MGLNPTKILWVEQDRCHGSSVERFCTGKTHDKHERGHYGPWSPFPRTIIRKRLKLAASPEQFYRICT